VTKPHRGNKCVFLRTSPFLCALVWLSSKGKRLMDLVFERHWIILKGLLSADIWTLLLRAAFRLLDGQQNWLSVDLGSLWRETKWSFTVYKRYQKCLAYNISGWTIITEYILYIGFVNTLFHLLLFFNIFIWYSWFNQETKRRSTVWINAYLFSEPYKRKAWK